MSRRRPQDRRRRGRLLRAPTRIQDYLPYLACAAADRRPGARGAPTDRRERSHAAADAEGARPRATPTVAHFDALGRPFLTVAHNGRQRTPRARRHRGVPSHPRRAGHRRQPARGARRRRHGDARVVMRYDYDMLGNRIHQASMEAGERWMLNDVAGKPSAPGTAADHRSAPPTTRCGGRAESSCAKRTREPELLVDKIEYGVYGEGRPIPRTQPATHLPALRGGVSHSTRRASSPATPTTSRATCCAAARLAQRLQGHRSTGRRPAARRPRPSPAAPATTRSTARPVHRAAQPGPRGRSTSSSPASTRPTCWSGWTCGSTGTPSRGGWIPRRFLQSGCRHRLRRQGPAHADRLRKRRQDHLRLRPADLLRSGPSLAPRPHGAWPGCRTSHYTYDPRATSPPFGTTPHLSSPSPPPPHPPPLFLSGGQFPKPV